MFTWDPTVYDRFDTERTRPAIDLAARVTHASPARVVDLGCGTGNSTAVCAARFPHAVVTGIDNSPEMLEKAAKTHADLTFVPGDIATWMPARTDDVVFTNAALQWVPGHAARMSAWLDALAPGAVLAVQMPRNFDSPSHTSMRAIASDGPWRDALAHVRDLIPVSEPAVYYDALVPYAARIDLWETEYVLPMPDADAIVEWVSGTGLRPFVAPLSAEHRAQFLDRYRTAIRAAYPARRDGTVLFPFRRLFVVAVRR